MFYVTTENQRKGLWLVRTWLLSSSAELKQPRNVHLKTSSVSILPPSGLPFYYQAVCLYISLFRSLTSFLSSVIRVLLKWMD